MVSIAGAFNIYLCLIIYVRSSEQQIEAQIRKDFGPDSSRMLNHRGPILPSDRANLNVNMINFFNILS
jgi:hypothetical protein